MNRSSILVLVLLSTACKPAGGPVTDADASAVEGGTITQGGGGLCSLLDGVDSDGTYRSICATVEEIAQAAAFILTLKTASAVDAGACKNLPGTTVCATSEQRAKTVLRIARARDAVLLKSNTSIADGGTR